MEERVEKILTFWFGDINASEEIPKDSPITKRWFVKSEEFDQQIHDQFQGDLIRARKGKYESWQQTPKGMLALIILFDQFSRNIFRDSAKAFENDLKALELCLLAIKEGFDEDLNSLECQFLYMPMMHSESLKIQEKSLEYYEMLVKLAEKDGKNVGYFKNVYTFAQRHYEVIKQFNRFPHRNAIVNRRSTQEELAFLEQPHSSF